MPRTFNDLEIFSEEELAGLRHIRLRTLRNERSRGLGPAYIRVGRRIFYSADAVATWLQAHQVAGKRGRP